MNRILVVGVPRSGSTWLAEMLAATPGSRAVLEPDNPAWHADAAAARQLLGDFPVLHAGDSAPEYERLWDRAFIGQSAMALPPHRSRRSRAPESIAPRNLVLKSVHGVLAIEWLVARYSPRVVLIERNPLNVVASWMQHGFEVSGLAQQEQVRLEHVQPLQLPAWDPFAPRILQVAWAIGVLMSAGREMARVHPDWVVVSHDGICLDPSTHLRRLSEAVGLEWSSDAERRLRASNAPGSGGQTKRVVSGLPAKWQSFSARDMQEVIAYLAQFPALAPWVPAEESNEAAHRVGSEDDDKVARMDAKVQELEAERRRLAGVVARQRLQIQAYERRLGVRLAGAIRRGEMAVRRAIRRP